MRFAGWLNVRADRRWGLSPRPEDDGSVDWGRSWHGLAGRSTSASLAPPPANGEEHDEADDHGVDHVLERLDRRLDLLVVLADDEPGIDERRVPRQRAERAEQEESSHRHRAEHARVAHEGPHQREHASPKAGPPAH